MYAHNDASDVSQAFENTVLVKNWYEDRFQSDVASTTGRTLREQPTKERVIHQAPGAHPGLWQTTKGETEHKLLTTPAPAKLKKPSMYTESNIAERMTTYGLADNIHYTLGPNAATEAAKPPVRHMVTTNQEFYETKPAAAMAADPDTFRAGTSSFAKTGLCVKSIRGEASDESGVAGGKGGRGEVTRRPGESGNPYGVSVYSDEYAKWGTALQGVPLTETVKKMQTKYF